MSVQLFDQLRTLNAIGRGILIQIYNIKQLLRDPSRADYAFDPNFVKVNKAIMVKFPELPPLEKTGVEIYKNRAKDILDAFAPMYNGLIDAVEFQAAALQMLNEAVKEISVFQMELNPYLTEEFFDLYVTYCQVHILAQKVEERRTFLILHRLCYYLLYNQKEENYDKIVKWLEVYEKPVRKLQNDLQSCSAKVVQSLVSMFMNYNKVRVTEQLRKENVLSIVMQGPAKLTQPAQSRVLLDMTRASRIYNWFIYGLLCSPEDLVQDGTMNALKSLMTEGIHAVVFRDETFFIYRDYEDMFNNYKSKTVKLSKEKPIFKEGATAGFEHGPKRHQERRIYLRQELETLLNLMKDTPALLAPKTMLVLAALSAAKEEILWLFRHRNKVPKYKSGKPEDFHDNRISELIYDLVQFQILLREKKQIIRQYWLEYLKGADCNRLRELADEKFKKSCGPVLWSAVQLFLDTLTKIDPKKDSDINFQDLRNAWYKTEVAISSIGNQIPFSEISKVIEKMSFIVLHTLYVDSLDELISRACSLRELWYFPKDFSEIFDKLIADGPNQPTHSMAFIILLSQFPENATPYDPKERDRIGEACVHLAHQMIGKITERVRDIINHIAIQYITIDNYSVEQNGIYALLEKKEGFKPDKRWQPPPKPGTESQINQREQHKNLRLYERNLWQLLSTFNEIHQITIHNMTFTPREYLVELIEIATKNFLSKVIVVSSDRQTNPKGPETILQPPSVIIRQLLIYWILGTFGGKLEWLNPKPVETPKNAIQVICTWYVDYVTNKLQQVGVCWAPNRRGFVSRRGLFFRAEQYGDIVELRKLCSLIGPYGVKLIDRELLLRIKSFVVSIKDKLKALRVDLNDILQNHHQEQKCAQTFRLLKVTEMDQAISVSIAMGKVLLFRQLLLEALATVVEERIPLLYNAIDTAFNLYGRNLFKVPEYTPMDALALDCGIDVGIADPELKEIFLPETQGDKKLWDLLPTLYATAFVTSTFWRDALYVPAIEGHDNNVHVLSKTISDLIIHFKSLTSESNSENEIIASLVQFVEMSTVFLIRLARTKGDKTVKNLPSVFVFLDMFVKECPMLTRKHVESIIPYALLRSMWREVYTTRKTLGEEQDIF